MVSRWQQKIAEPSHPMLLPAMSCPQPSATVSWGACLFHGSARGWHPWQYPPPSPLPCRLHAHLHHNCTAPASQYIVPRICIAPARKRKMQLEAFSNLPSCCWRVEPDPARCWQDRETAACRLGRWSGSIAEGCGWQEEQGGG